MSSYSKGLEIADMVTFMHKVFTKQFVGPRTAIVLDRNYLFESKTRFGLRKFFKYQMLDVQNNKVYNIKTNDIKVVKITKGKS